MAQPEDRLRAATRRHLAYLVRDFGFREARADDWEHPRSYTVSYLGPVGVRALCEPELDVVELSVQILEDGHFRVLAPVVDMTIEWIIRARAPEREVSYHEIRRMRPVPLEKYFETASVDLRAYAADILTGESFSLVDEVRDQIRATLPGRGVPGTDWWAA